MSTLLDFIEVSPVGVAREEFSKVMARFRTDGITATPVIFGSHRKPEAVTIPYELFQRVLPAIEDVFLAELIKSRLHDPKVTWEEALKRLNISQSDIDKIVDDDYQVSTEEI